MFAPMLPAIDHAAVHGALNTAPPIPPEHSSPIAELPPDTMRLVLGNVQRPVDLARFARASHAAHAYAADFMSDLMQHVHELDAACVQAFGSASALRERAHETPTQAEIIKHFQQLSRFCSAPERRRAFLTLMPHAAQLDLAAQRRLVAEAFAELSPDSGRVRKLPGLLHLRQALTPDERPMVVQAVAQLFRTPDMRVAGRDIGEALGGGDGARHVLDFYPDLGRAIAGLDQLDKAHIMQAISELATDAKCLDVHTRLGRAFIESLAAPEQAALQMKISAYILKAQSNAERARAIRFAGMGDGFFGERLEASQIYQIFDHIRALRVPLKRATAFSHAAPFFARYNDQVPLEARQLLESMICLDVPDPLERHLPTGGEYAPAVRAQVELAARLAAPHVENVLNGYGFNDSSSEARLSAVRRFLHLHEPDLQVAAILMLRTRPPHAARIADSRFSDIRHVESLSGVGIQAMISLFVETAAEHEAIDGLENLAPLVSRMSPEVQTCWRRALIHSSPLLASNLAHAIRLVLPTLDLSTEGARLEWRTLLARAYGVAGA